MLSFLLPGTCSYCRTPVRSSSVPFFCDQCWSDFTQVPGPVCPGCGRPFGSPEALSSSPEHRCHACRREPPQFDQALSTGLFEGPLREAVHRYKYGPVRSLGGPLGRWMADRILLRDGIDLVMPVPLHRRRLRTRGFNQALLLASVVADRFQLSLVYDNLLRVRDTRPQVELSGAERTRNVRGAFAVARASDIDGQRVLLVDDVFTTGATLNECAAVLKTAGALAVTALTLARPMD